MPSKLRPRNGSSGRSRPALSMHKNTDWPSADESFVPCQIRARTSNSPSQVWADRTGAHWTQLPERGSARREQAEVPDLSALVTATRSSIPGHVPPRGVNGLHRDLVSGLVLTMP